MNINTADEITLRSLGMSEELAKKVAHFRENQASQEKSAEEDIPNYFDDIAKIVIYLTKKESISAEESGKITSLIARNLLGVSSDNFSGAAMGKIGNKGIEARIGFVFDRKNNVLRYWGE